MKRFGKVHSVTDEVRVTKKRIQDYGSETSMPTFPHLEVTTRGLRGSDCIVPFDLKEMILAQRVLEEREP